MIKIILLITLFSFAVQATENTKDLDIRNLTDQQIRFKVFDFESGMRWQETLDFCEKVLEQKPYNPEAHFGKGRALTKLNRCKEAVKSFDLAIKYNRKPFGEVYYYKGIALESLEMLEEALIAYDLAIENDFDYRYVFYFRTGVLIKLDKLNK